jgi:hypothetical protein
VEIQAVATSTSVSAISRSVLEIVGVTTSEKMQGDWTVSALQFRINLTARRRRIRILLTILESFIVYPPDRTPSVDTLETATSLSAYSFLPGFPWHETKGVSHSRVELRTGDEGHLGIIGKDHARLRNRYAVVVCMAIYNFTEFHILGRLLTIDNIGVSVF